MAKVRSYLTSFGLPTFYLLATITFGVFGWYLQHIAFTQPPAASQVYAAVFVRDPAARVSLSAEVYPDEPWTDSLKVTVSTPSHSQTGWLLVIECPTGAPSQSRAIRIDSETVPPTQSSITLATVYPGVTTPRHHRMFDCFPSPASPSAPLGASAYSPSLANVSLPALELDQGITAAQADPVLYAQQDRPGGTVGRLMQIFPSAVCPSLTTAPVQASASAGPASASPATAPSPQLCSSVAVTDGHTVPRRRCESSLLRPATTSRRHVHPVPPSRFGNYN
jgi:hypothetical protein